MLEEHDDVAGTWSVVQVARKCSAHASIPDNELYDTLHAAPASEGKRRNRLRGWVEENAPGVTVDVSWSGTGKNRVLLITTTGATQQQKNFAQNWCDQQFGAGKVVIS